VENASYRRLDNRIFEYDLNSGETVEISTEKPVGQNDLDPKYSPDDGFVIYTRTSNDGISERVIQRTQVTLNNAVVNELLFTDAFMPFWE
jgi:Tol biopolymer transport system component